VVLRSCLFAMKHQAYMIYPAKTHEIAMDIDFTGCMRNIANFTQRAFIEIFESRFGAELILDAPV